MDIGSVVICKKDNFDLHIREGDVGYVYERYGIGISVIFSNGNIEGFTKKEQREYLEVVYKSTFRYRFQGAAKMHADFQNGAFNRVFFWQEKTHERY